MSLPLSNHVSSFLTFVFMTSPSPTFYDSCNCEGFVPVFHAALFCAVCWSQPETTGQNYLDFQHISSFNCWVMWHSNDAPPLAVADVLSSRGGLNQRGRGAVCGCAFALFSGLSNPHVKLFPALHRKLPAKGPTVTAFFWECGGGSMGGWEGSMRLGVWGLLDSCGDPKAPTSTVPKRWPQAVTHVDFFMSAILTGYIAVCMAKKV